MTHASLATCGCFRRCGCVLAFLEQPWPRAVGDGRRCFAARFAGRRGKIKALLLDQTVLAGCGNIYADESLFRAGIRPDAQNVSADRLKRLHAALREVLLESIDACGSSIRDYRTARGDAGAFSERLPCLWAFRRGLR